MRRAGPEDFPAIDAFLQAHVDRSMFPLKNLRDHGPDSTSDYAMRFWIAGAGAITDVLGVTRAGMVMPQCPTGPWEAAANALRGQSLTGVIGPAEQTRPLMAAAGLESAPATLDRDEPFMRLNLSDLQVPDGPGDIVPLAKAPAEVILDWMKTYQREALHTPEDEIDWRAEGSYARYCERQSHMALIDGGVPLAMTGFNAALPGIVQIGGVFTPVPLRGRGHARRALALHLRQVAARGVTRAVLFSASSAARRAYEGIGFRQAGAWTLCLFAAPVTAG